MSSTQSSATQLSPTMTGPQRNAFLRWFMPEVPLARVAVFRAIIYLFIIIDVLTISGDVIPYGWTRSSTSRCGWPGSSGSRR